MSLDDNHFHVVITANDFDPIPQKQILIIFMHSFSLKTNEVGSIPSLYG